MRYCLRDNIFLLCVEGESPDRLALGVIIGHIDGNSGVGDIVPPCLHIEGLFTVIEGVEEFSCVDISEGLAMTAVDACCEKVREDIEVLGGYPGAYMTVGLAL